jgi:hypothetical protein
MSGGDAIAGNTTLGASGTITINTTKVTATSVIIPIMDEAMTGPLYIANKVNGTSFDIVSVAGIADNAKKVRWLLVDTR